MLTNIASIPQPVATPSEIDQHDPPDALSNKPHIFIADTDSDPIVFDTGANRIILNNVALFEQLHDSRSQIKGINGTLTATSGHGIHRFRLQADDGTVDELPLPAMWVPTCPYNLMPPQLLVRHLKEAGFDVQGCTHDDRVYRLIYKRPQDATFKELTIPIGSNDLFTFRSQPGFNKFL